MQHATERYNLTPSVVQSISHQLVVWVVSRRNVLQGAIFLGRLDIQLEDVETIVYLKILSHVSRVEGIELRLSLAQRLFQFTGLQDMMRMIRGHTQSLTAIYDVFTQSQSQRGNALLGLFVANGIIIQRAQHTTYLGIIVRTILLAHHFLQDNRHFFLIDQVASSRHVSLGIMIEHRCIHTLDGTSQHLEHHLLVIKRWNHISRIDSGKRLVVRVFQQRTGTNGYRTLGGIEKRDEVVAQTLWQLGFQEAVQYLFVCRIAQGNVIKIVLVHELVEQIRTKHQRFRNLYLHSFVLIKVGVHLDDMV